jgi:hypothetical protein
MQRKIWLAVCIAAALAILALLVAGASGMPEVATHPPGSFAFAALGDAPYDVLEDLRYPFLLRDIAAHDLSFVVHVGDIFWGTCTDARYRRSLDWFDSLPHPVIYTPGDNEWCDCWQRVSGRYAPRDRLSRIREIFFATPERSLGGKTLALASQGGEFVENARWSHEGVVFATVHIPGSSNGYERFPGRTAADDEEVRRRTAAASAWVHATFEEARGSSAAAVVLSFQANPSFEAPPDDPERLCFEPFLTALEEEVERFPGPVLAVHGDQHVYLVDQPLVRRTTGARLTNFTRLQVPGSPRVGWVHVVVTPGAEPLFAFQPRVVPRWKYW